MPVEILPFHAVPDLELPQKRFPVDAYAHAGELEGIRADRDSSRKDAASPGPAFSDRRIEKMQKDDILFRFDSIH